MEVKNVKTGKAYHITEKAFAKIKERGEADKFQVTSTATKAGEAPKELKKADYAAIAKDAAAAFEAKDYAKAKEAYKAAYAIKETKFVKDKLEELEGLLGHSLESGAVGTAQAYE